MAAIDVDIHPGIDASTINLRVLAAASLFASKEKAWYYLNGVMIEFDHGGATYVATDGTKMICYRDDSAQGTNMLTGRFIIPTGHCKHFKFGKDEEGIGKIFSENGGEGRLTIAYGFVDIKFSPSGGPYPNWRRVLPRRPATGALAQYHLPFLADFQKFADALSLPRPFVAANGDAPAPIWFPGLKSVFGILIPIRSTDELSREPPDWSKPLAGDEDQGDLEDSIDGAGNVEKLAPRKRGAS